MLQIKKRQKAECSQEIITKKFKPNLRVSMLWEAIIEELVKLPNKQQKPKDLR